MFLLLAGAIVMITIKNLSLTGAFRSYLSSLIDCLFLIRISAILSLLTSRILQRRLFENGFKVAHLKNNFYRDLAGIFSEKSQ